MSQATYQKPGAAMARLKNERIVTDSGQQWDDRERYLFFAGAIPWTEHPELSPIGGLSIDTPCVIGKMIPRCSVTPLLTTPVPAMIETIPDGQRIPNSEMYDKDGRAIAMLYLRHSGAEAKEVLANYGKWGLIELEALRGASIQAVEELSIDQIFFPTWPNIPQLNTELLASIEATRAEIAAAKHPGVKPGEQLRALYLEIADAMIKGVKAFDAWARRELEKTHRAMEVPHTDPQFKRTYDEKDFLLLKFTGIAERSEALDAMKRDRVVKVETTGGLSKQDLQEVIAAATQQQPVSNIGEIVAAVMAAMQAQAAQAAAPTAVAPPVEKTAEKNEAKPSAPALNRK